ncbi:MAG: FecR domain-containing protein [Gemmatimonadaceae bacterium]
MTDSERPFPDETPIPAEDPYWESLGRFATGNAGKDEVGRIRERLVENPADAGLLEAMERVLPPMPDWDIAPAQVEMALRRVNERRREAPAKLRVVQGNTRRVPQRRRINVGMVSGLAAAAILAAVALWPTQNGGNSKNPDTSRVVQTTAGQRDSVRLPDGSRVVLAPLSRLEFAADYGRRNRLVRLTGEALFDVQHDATRPFAITTPSARIEDLGTTFTVRDDASDSVIVRVTHGSVRVRGQHDSVGTATLMAGDVGVLRGASVDVRRGSVSAKDTSWVHGELAFRDATMDEVTAQMHRWYGVRIRVADEVLERRHVTATLADEPVDRALQIIALALGAEVERTGDTAVVRLPKQISSTR